MIWLGKSDEVISLVALRDIFMYELSMNDFLLKNEKRRVHKFLNKSRKLRGGAIITSHSLKGLCLSFED